MVGKGVKLPCNSICQNVPVTVGNTNFYYWLLCLTDKWSWPCIGHSMVKNAGSNSHGLASLTMQLQWLGNNITLRGIWSNCIKEFLWELKRLHDTTSIPAFCHLALTMLTLTTLLSFLIIFLLYNLFFSIFIFFSKNLRTYHHNVFIVIISVWSLMRAQATCLHIFNLIIKNMKLKN